MQPMKDAKSLARNPLGIVALFISLIYGFASLLLSSAVDKLQDIERWPLILFVVIFPFSVLFVFYKLVTNHHGKLYSPSDYKEDDSFLRTLSRDEKERKLEMEAKEAIGDVFVEKDASINSPILDATKKRIKNVESYIISSIASELGLAASTHMTIGNENISYDAVFVEQNKYLIALEVKYYSRPIVTAKAIESYINKVSATSRYMSIETRFILVLVFEGDKEEFDFIVKIWEGKLKKLELKVDLRIVSGDSIYL
ncbi:MULTISPECIES: hypothetical protein [unclassified Aeromonas]|uniref:hypothetical protein n=1 Tax=unclassified Aeromonas TaxID=257493 RepID=UPI00084AB4A9|nr:MULTISPECIES: hypothetical protein [unclassified Aeromonas]OEC55830.1 hypothetical protein A9G04_08965 [Aeromonas sp. ANNP30]OEC65652.1 hypothetical protein A9G49_08700 [Aeromonas sp. ANP5]